MPKSCIKHRWSLWFSWTLRLVFTLSSSVGTTYLLGYSFYQKSNQGSETCRQQDYQCHDTCGETQVINLTVTG